jgi:hypothetical protein
VSKKSTRRAAALAANLAAANRQVKLALLALERAMLAGKDVEEKRAKLARKMAWATKLHNDARRRAEKQDKRR